MLQRRAEQRLAGHEHDHEVGRRLEVLPVGLVPELDDVIAHLARVMAQLAVALRLVLGLHRVQERRRRDLGVDDDVLAAGQADDHVRRETAAVAVDRFFQVEVAVFEHAGRFDDPPQLQLAPLAADVRRAEGLHEPAGLDLERLLRGVERPAAAR